MNERETSNVPRILLRLAFRFADAGIIGLPAVGLRAEAFFAVRPCIIVWRTRLAGSRLAGMSPGGPMKGVPAAAARQEEYGWR